MNSLDKIALIKEAQKRNEDLEDFFDFNTKGLTKKELDLLLKGTFKLPEEYLSIILEIDGFEINGINFCGSGNGHYLSFLDLSKISNNVIDFDKFFPFAKDVEGSIFVLDQSSKVYVYQNFPPYNNLLITEGFETFLADFLLGDKILELYLEEDFKEDEYYVILEELKFLKKH